MGQIPYRGGLGGPLDEDPWVNLTTIYEYLYDGEVVPPALAQWLGNAIEFSDRDPAELLRRLGIKRRRGRPRHKHADDAWFIWGQRVDEVERRDGAKPEHALKRALDEYATKNAEPVSRTQMRQWRDRYRTAMDANG